MIQYKCDMCGQEGFSKNEIAVIDKFPRIVRSYAKDNIGVKLFSCDRYYTVETHLCDVCCSKLARLLPIVEEE